MRDIIEDVLGALALFGTFYAGSLLLYGISG